MTVLTALLLLAPAAHAQISKKRHGGGQQAEQKPRVDEKAYKAALDRIPDPKKPYDPWGQVHDGSAATPGSKH